MSSQELLVMSVVPAAACILILSSLRAITSCWSEVQITKCEITVSECILEGTDTRASGTGGLFSLSAVVSGFLKYQLHIKEILYL